MKRRGKGDDQHSKHLIYAPNIDEKGWPLYKPSTMLLGLLKALVKAQLMKLYYTKLEQTLIGRGLFSLAKSLNSI
jgi:hypothetical protein